MSRLRYRNLKPQHPESPSHKTLAWVIAVAAVLSILPPDGSAQALKPNVILIMADDLGAEGLGSYGSTIYKTPNLDKMADQGIRFDNAYATPLCTPTRVMLMTGQYPNRTGFTNLISNDKKARMPGTLKTFGTYFKNAGYKTAVAGKWQLGRFDQFSNQPMEHGFDEYCLWKWKFHNKKSSRYYHPGIWCNAASADGGPHDFGPDIYLNFVLDFIERNRRSPFFVYFPMALVHLPLVKPPRIPMAAQDAYPKGIKKKTAQFGRMITYMDKMVGAIVQKLKEVGIDKDTLIIFTGDNGSPKEIQSPLAGLVVPGGKGNKTEAGTRVPFIAKWPGKIPPGVRTGLFSLVDVLPTIASIAHIPVSREVDGLDLSHMFFGTNGKDRDDVFFAFKDDFWVRDKTFRYHNDGSLFYCPITSDKSRYHARLVEKGKYKADRERLRTALETYKASIPAVDAGNAVRKTKRQKRLKHASQATPLKQEAPL